MQKWSYYVAVFERRVRKTGGFMQPEETTWVFFAGGSEYSLPEGLRLLGEKGFELVAVTPFALPYGGSETDKWAYPKYNFIFKRPGEPDAPA